LAEYKRMVSYMYSYENGLKGKNIGFAKVEAKDGQCKVLLSLKGVYPVKRSCKVYFFHRTVAGMEGILLGDMGINNGIGEQRFYTSEKNIMNSGYRLDDMGGIVAVSSERRIYATEWDDQGVSVEQFYVNREEDLPLCAAEFLEEDPEEGEQEGKQKETEQAGGAEETEQTEETGSAAEELEKLMQNIREITKESFEEDEELSIEKIDDTDGIEEIEEQTEGEEAEQTEKEDDDSDEILNMINELKALEEEMKERRSEILRKAGINYKRRRKTDVLEETKTADDIVKEQEIAIEEKTVDAAKIKETERVKEEKQQIPKEEAESEKDNEKSAAEDELEVEKMLREYPPVYSIEDERMVSCIKITPQDIGKLPMEVWMLGNNSFLLHGYYNYRYLILAKRKDEIGGNSHYIVGVPGIFQNREKFMAAMFGFDQFITEKKREQKTGEFGYWCRKL
jgi:hypothetical protein